MPWKIHHSLGCTNVVSWNIDKKLINNERQFVDSRPSTIDDYIIKWFLKHRIVLSIEKLWQKLSLEWYSRRAVLIGWFEDSLDAFVARATVETEYFEVFGDLLSVFIVILPSVKNGSTKRAWRRNNWTVREEGFRSCHCLRSFSMQNAPFGGAELSLKINDIFFLLLFWQSAVIVITGGPDVVCVTEWIY